MKYMFNIVMYREACEPICFQLGMMLNTTEQVDSNLNNLDVHSRSQDYENARTCAVIVL